MQTWELAPTLPWKYRAQSKAPFGPVKPSMVCTTSSRLVPPLELFGLGVQTLVSVIAAVLAPAPRLALLGDGRLGVGLDLLQLDVLAVAVGHARPDQSSGHQPSSCVLDRGQVRGHLALDNQS